MAGVVTMISSDMTRPRPSGVGMSLLVRALPRERGELRPHLRLLAGREDVDDAVDGLGAGIGVEGAEGQVARLGDGEGRRDGFEVTRFRPREPRRDPGGGRCYERVLKAGVREDPRAGSPGTSCGCERTRWIFDGHDVLGPLAADLVHHGREGGGLARRPVGPVTRMRPLGRSASCSTIVGRPSSSKVRILDGDDADGGSHGAPLAVQRCSESARGLECQRTGRARCPPRTSASVPR